MNQPLVLLVLDGWGVDSPNAYNAIENASTPQWDSWWHSMPHGLLEAHGEAVGLPKGQMGNSEVGHMHIGAGRKILQDFTQINQAIQNKEWETNPVFIHLFKDVISKKERLHIMGLLSPGGVHAHEDHLFAFLKLCHKMGVDGVQLHLFLDGRDTLPQSASESLLRLTSLLDELGVGRIATICGRYFAMDRDKRWDRTEKTYRLLTEGVGEKRFPDVQTALTAYYKVNCFDEFIPPTVIGAPLPIKNGDSVFCFNYRSDRIRQLTEALVLPAFSGFKRTKQVDFGNFVTMTQYEAGLPVEVAFKSQPLINTLGEVLAKHGLTQLRLAETEKYAHVTFFFNGGAEAIYEGEDRELIPSPLVATYDLTPDMSAHLITKALVKHILAKTYDVIICNYANADMVGHTGVMSAAVDAITCLDTCMQEVSKAVLSVGGCMMITADHGNAEVMFDEESGQPHTAHTSQPVPFVFVGKGWKYQAKHGSLVDVAPTILKVLGLSQPKEMTGTSLLIKE